MRKSGASAGQYDVYYYSPDGRRFRSKPEILKFMEKVGQSVDISVFDFRKKKLRDRPLSRMATPLKSSTVRSPTEYSHSKYTITNELQLPPKSQASPVVINVARSCSSIKLPVVYSCDRNASNNNGLSTKMSTEAIAQSTNSPSIDKVVQKLWKQKTPQNQFNTFRKAGSLSPTVKHSFGVPQSTGSVTSSLPTSPVLSSVANPSLNKGRVLKSNS